MKETHQRSEPKRRRVARTIEDTTRYILNELKSTEVAEYGNRLSKVGTVIQQIDKAHYLTALSMTVFFNYRQGAQLTMLGVEKMLQKRSMRKSQQNPI